MIVEAEKHRHIQAEFIQVIKRLTHNDERYTYEFKKDVRRLYELHIERDKIIKEIDRAGDSGKDYFNNIKFN